MITTRFRLRFDVKSIPQTPICRSNGRRRAKLRSKHQTKCHWRTPWRGSTMPQWNVPPPMPPTQVAECRSSISSTQIAECRRPNSSPTGFYGDASRHHGHEQQRKRHRRRTDGWLRLVILDAMDCLSGTWWMGGIDLWLITFRFSNRRWIKSSTIFDDDVCVKI